MSCGPWGPKKAGAGAHDSRAGKAPVNGKGDLRTRGNDTPARCHRFASNMKTLLLSVIDCLADIGVWSAPTLCSGPTVDQDDSCKPSR